jgi:hypothetical protein
MHRVSTVGASEKQGQRKPKSWERVGEQTHNTIVMKIKLFQIGLAALIAFGLHSCEKEADPEPVNGLVKSVSVVLGGTTSIESYSYDEQGRIVLVTITQTGEFPGTETTTYSYSQNTVVAIVEFDGGGTMTTTYNLNADGYAVSDSDGSTYNYNADGHMTSAIYPWRTETRTWSGGNMVSISYSDGTPTDTYTYLTDKGDYRDYGKGWSGKRSKNLVSSVSNVNIGVNITYEFDAKGRVTKETHTDPGSNSMVYTYTYKD